MIRLYKEDCREVSEIIMSKYNRYLQSNIDVALLKTRMEMLSLQIEDQNNIPDWIKKCLRSCCDMLNIDD